MKSKKTTRPIDANGRVVIPKDLITDVFKATADEHIAVEVHYTDDSIILKRFQPTCTFCDRSDGLKEFKGIKICPDCLEEIKTL